MNAIQPKSITLNVSKIHPDGWWLGNTQEFVAKGTALGADYTENIYQPSNEKMIGKYDRESNSWNEIENRALEEYWDQKGQAYVIGVPDGDYPEWAVLQNPPEYDDETQTVLYQDDQWHVYDIEIGKSYWDSEGNELIISDYNFTLFNDHTFTKPPKEKQGFVIRLVDDEWQYIADYREQVIYDCTDATHSETIQEVGGIPDGWTLLKPSTQHDEWIDNAWVTNLQAQYEAQVQQVDAARRSLYLNVDALRNEAAMIRMLSTDETKSADEAKAADYDEQAKALYLKIRDENPWPTAPTE